MNVWLLTVPAFLVFCAGAYCSYTKTVRDHWTYLPAIILLTATSGWLWVVATRKLDGVREILFFSLVWDVLMVVSYYVLPIVLKGQGFGWQTYAAAAMAGTGIIWFKFTIDQGG